MKRCEENGMWSLMCPNECPGLQDCWGEKFEKLYERSAEYKESYSFYNSPSLMFYSKSFLVKSRGSVLHMQEKIAANNKQYFGVIRTPLSSSK